MPIFGLVEPSGTGATSGSNFNNGIKLAVKEINAATGILGRKMAHQSVDTQSNPGIARALSQTAVDQSAYVVMGSVFSGSLTPFPPSLARSTSARRCCASCSRAATRLSSMATKKNQRARCASCASRPTPNPSSARSC
ncbi:MAG: ABC transporter substrate-binding protein [Polaromonas sp.]|nr:ABC transporter substrate-binding protein [Polaromonas sp.]